MNADALQRHRRPARTGPQPLAPASLTACADL